MGTTAAAVTEKSDGLVVIGWQDESFFEGSLENNDIAAAAEVSYGLTNPTDVYIAFNSVAFNKNDEDPLKLIGVMTQELGHFLGLAHSDQNESILFAEPYHDYVYQSMLKQDDINAVQAIYPISATEEDSCSNINTTTIFSSLDIFIPLARETNQQTPTGYWATLTYLGVEQDGYQYWKMTQIKQYTVRSDACWIQNAVKIADNFDLTIPIATIAVSDQLQKLWVNMKYEGTKAQGRLIWKLKSFTEL